MRCSPVLHDRKGAVPFVSPELSNGSVFCNAATATVQKIAWRFPAATIM